MSIIKKQLSALMILLGVLVCLALCILSGASSFGLPDLSDIAGRTILELRIARLITGFMVGAALAAAGCVLQAVLRNPLAEPYVLGISSGGTLGAVIAITSGISIMLPLSLPLLAFGANLITLMVVYRISSRQGNCDPTRLILTGVVVSTMLASLIMLLHSIQTTHRGQSVTWWMMGNLQALSWPLIVTVAVMITLSICTLLTQTRELNALLLGTEQAQLLGVRVKIALPLLLGAATLATAAAVAVSGIIGFVGLIVPHVLRRIVGANHRQLLPWTIVAGGTFLVLCDTLARLLLAPREIPVGVITALAGGPFFLWLLMRQRKVTLFTEPHRYGRERGVSLPANGAAITLQDVSVTLSGKSVLEHITFAIAPGERVAILGPNGSGKSTLLRAIAGLVPLHGNISVARTSEGHAVTPLAIHLALVPQESPVNMPLSAFEFVLLGRTSLLPRFGGPTASDLAAATDAMTLTSTLHLRNRALSEMSGGERQRITIAMALAGNPSILLLDEPTSHLDLHHRAELMQLLMRLCKERQITLLTVVHDLTLAGQFFPRLLLLSSGKVVADGSPDKIMQAELLQGVYGCPLEVIPLPGSASACVLLKEC